jgi:hypothetical protein
MSYLLHREGQSESRGLTIRSSRNRFVAPELSWGFKGGFGLTQVLGLIKRQIGSRTTIGLLFAFVIGQPVSLRDVVANLALARRAFGFVASGELR